MRFPSVHYYLRMACCFPLDVAHWNANIHNIVSLIVDPWARWTDRGGFYSVTVAFQQSFRVHYWLGKSQFCHQADLSGMQLVWSTLLKVKDCGFALFITDFIANPTQCLMLVCASSHPRSPFGDDGYSTTTSSDVSPERLSSNKLLMSWQGFRSESARVCAPSLPDRLLWKNS